jgi:hypothetical protein
LVSVAADAVRRAKAGDAKAREWVSRYLVGSAIAVAPRPSDAIFEEEGGRDRVDARLVDSRLREELLSDILNGGAA